MRVRVDKNLCKGCGLCSDICPEIFEFDGSKAKAKVDKVPTEVEGACRDAAQQCPPEAIKIGED